LRHTDGVTMQAGRRTLFVAGAAKVQVYVCEYDAYGTLQTLGMTDRDYTLPARGSRSWFGESKGSWAKPSLVTVRAYENMNG
jgi:hypothetical protein